MDVDSDRWDEFDTMSDFNEAEKLFDGKHLKPAARNGGRSKPASGRRSAPINTSARDPLTPVAAND